MYESTVESSSITRKKQVQKMSIKNFTPIDLLTQMSSVHRFVRPDSVLVIICETGRNVAIKGNMEPTLIVLGQNKINHTGPRILRP